MGEVSSFTSSQANLSNPLNLADTIKQDFRMMEEEFKPKFDMVVARLQVRCQIDIVRAFFLRSITFWCLIEATGLLLRRTWIFP